MEKPCRICGGLILKIKPARFHRTRYCSRNCARQGWKGQRRSRRTEFQPGVPRVQPYEEGTITTRRDKNGRQRQWIKSDGQWQEYALWLWKQRYARLLPGDVVHHLNGNSMDDRLSNLIGMPRAHHPMFHSMWGLKEIPTEQLAVYRQRYLSVMELEAK